MYKKLLTFAFCATIFLASGCGNKMWEDTKDTAGDTYDYVFDTAPTAKSYHDEEVIPIIEVNYQAADILAAHIRANELTKESPIYVKVFTNAQNPADNSIFGLVMTQQVADRLVQRSVIIKKGEPKPDEYFLPQGVDKMDYADAVKNTSGELPPRAAILDGHYVIGNQYVYLTAKVTRLDDSAIVSGHNWTVPLSDNVKHLLGQPRQKDGLKPTVKTRVAEEQ